MKQSKQESQGLVLSLAQLAHDKQGEDPVVLDVSGPLVIADYFLIVTARNSRHAVALARELNAYCKSAGLGEQARRGISGMEGEGGWILLDVDLVVVHILTPEMRQFYDLEGLWADAPRVEFTPLDKTPVARSGGGLLEDEEPIWGDAPGAE